jgi:BASS family bile acid:Na+ symporter
MATRSSAFFNSYGKGLSLFAMMLLGAFFPQAHALSFLIQYLVMLMLFFAFLDVEFNPKRFQRGVLWVLLANVAVAFIGYGIFASRNLTFGLVAFITGIAPSAIASPVVISFVEGRVDYAVTAVLVTNVSSALIIPLVLPSLVGAAVPISVWEVLRSALTVMLVPLTLAWLVLRLPPGGRAFVRKGKRFSFPIWLINLIIISANAANFIRTQSTGSAGILAEIALISLAICVVNFALGAWIGGRQYWQEASQALGQKNLSFVIWIALTFINPLVAMGPTSYILYHHLYNSWLISRFEQRRLRVRSI